VAFAQQLSRGTVFGRSDIGCRQVLAGFVITALRQLDLTQTPQRSYVAGIQAYGLLIEIGYQRGLTLIVPAQGILQLNSGPMVRRKLSAGLP
jgi:hypothetical protein